MHPHKRIEELETMLAESRQVGLSAISRAEKWREAHEELISKIIKEADARVAMIVAEHKNAAEKAAQQKKLQEERAKEVRERAQLAALRTKYEE